jgi:regulator of protease activity HflC (stomatin/prohibitin superfamily)
VIEQLVAILRDFWRALIPWIVLHEDHAGFVRRLGKTHRDLKHGWNLLIPFIDEPFVESTRLGVFQLDPQSLTTRDGKTVSIRLSVQLWVDNVQRYYLHADAPKENIQDLVSGLLGAVVHKLDLSDVLRCSFRPKVEREAAAAACAWGLRIESVAVVDCVPARTIRLLSSAFQASD